jgi:hypothetical protein
MFRFPYSSYEQHTEKLMYYYEIWGSHSGDYEDYSLVECNNVDVLPPSSR